MLRAVVKNSDTTILSVPTILATSLLFSAGYTAVIPVPNTATVRPPSQGPPCARRCDLPTSPETMLTLCSASLRAIRLVRLKPSSVTLRVPTTAIDVRPSGGRGRPDGTTTAGDCGCDADFQYVGCARSLDSISVPSLRPRRGSAPGEPAAQ